MHTQRTWLTALALLSLTALPCFAQSNVQPGQEYAWGENLGWTNCLDANGTNDGVVVGSTFLSGYVWCENVGWLNLGDGTPGGGSEYTNTDGADHGVNVSPLGALSGFAWGENIGWVNFASATFDRIGGRFTGFAWGENVGWINLDDASSAVAVLPPTNDACSDAIPVSEGSVVYDNTGADTDGPTACDGDLTNDVWFLYTASATGTAVIDTCAAPAGGVADTTLIVYVGGACPTAGDTGLACDDDTCAPASGGNAFLSEVEVSVTAGESYLVQVGGWQSTANSLGEGVLTIALTPAEVCGDGVDNDLDGLTDCDDSDCADDPACPEVDCGDGVDNDLDGLTDCDDSDCVGDPACVEVDCADGVDNDLDGLTDCDDPDCAGDPACACTSCVGLRGDVNSDSAVNIADAVSLLNFLFVSGPAPAPCEESGDANADGGLNIGDAVYVLNFLFSGGPPPAAPGFPTPECLDL